MELQSLDPTSRPIAASCFTSTSYLNSINEYKLVFNRLDTTSLIPSLNYFLKKPNENESGDGPPSECTNADHLIRKMSIHLFQLESFSFCGAKETKDASNVNQASSENRQLPLLAKSNLKYRQLSCHLSSSEPNLSSTLLDEANEWELQEGLEQQKKFHTALNKKLTKIQKKAGMGSGKDVFKLKERFKFGGNFCVALKQFVTCNGQVGRRLVGNSSSRNSTRFRDRSKSLGQLLIDDSKKRSRQSVNKSFARYKIERVLLANLNKEYDNKTTPAVNASNTPLPVSPPPVPPQPPPQQDMNAIEFTHSSNKVSEEAIRKYHLENGLSNRGKFERFLKLTHLNLRSKSLNYTNKRRHLSETNLRGAGVDVDTRHRYHHNEQDEKFLRAFLSKKKLCSRRNAICSRIDKLEQNRTLINYMEFLLREDYIKNFLL